MDSIQNVEDYFSAHEEVSKKIDFSQIHFKKAIKINPKHFKSHYQIALLITEMAEK